MDGAPTFREQEPGLTKAGVLQGFPGLLDVFLRLSVPAFKSGWSRMVSRYGSATSGDILPFSKRGKNKDVVLQQTIFRKGRVEGQCGDSV